jgi:hypothetical protein
LPVKADFVPLVFRTEASRETPMTVQQKANGSADLAKRDPANDFI